MLRIPVRSGRPGASAYVAQERVCVECRELFVITPAEAAWYEARRLALPRRCKPCLKCRRRRESLESRGYQVFDAVCGDCGGRTVVPFDPSRVEGRVRCADCYVAAGAEEGARVGA